MSRQEMVDKLVRNIPNMAKISFTMYFGHPGKGPHTIEDLQKFAREKLETQVGDGEYLLDLEIIYDDAEGNGELID